MDAEMAAMYEERIKNQREMITSMQSKLFRIDKLAKRSVEDIGLRRSEYIVEMQDALRGINTIIREARKQ